MTPQVPSPRCSKAHVIQGMVPNTPKAELQLLPAATEPRVVGATSSYTGRAEQSPSAGFFDHLSIYVT